MIKKTKKNPLSLSAIIPVYNASSTVKISLDSLKKQTIPLKEIIIIDNKSTDDSLEVISSYKKKNPKLNIKIIQQKKTKSVSSSLNAAIKRAKGKFILCMHSDSSLESKHELEKLIKPFEKDPPVVASYSYVLHPEKIWKKYNFWEKCQSCRVMGKRIPGLNGKFDCYRREAIIKLGGFDDVNFDKYGDGSDADIHYRLKTIGKVMLTDAEVVHLHYLKNDYSLMDWILKRKNMSITSARLLRMYLLKTDLKGIVTFLIRPFISILPFIPKVHLLGILILIAFSFFYTWTMFVHPATRSNPRVILLFFVNIFLVYFESLWFMYIFLTHTPKVKRHI